MKRLFPLATAMVAAVMICCGAAQADDAYITTTFSNYSLQQFEHDDLAPFKGSANITVTNDTSDFWNGFHLEVFSVRGSNISQTIFVDGMIGSLNCDPTSASNGISSWQINNDPAGASMDVYFATLVNPGATATIKVYTDNTFYKQKFGLAMYPISPVPEPPCVIAFLTGIVGLFGYATRRK